MTSDLAPERLNWVGARIKCSLPQIFKALELGVREDVEEMQSNLGPHDEVKFSVASSNKRFSAMRVDDPMMSIMVSVDFVLSKDEITVSTSSNDGAEVLFTAGITLNNEGRCKLKVKDIELEQWQVRRLALEKLFFGPRS
jgi:hypothetical protein